MSGTRTASEQYGENAFSQVMDNNEQILSENAGATNADTNSQDVLVSSASEGIAKGDVAHRAGSQSTCPTAMAEDAASRDPLSVFGVSDSTLDGELHVWTGSPWSLAADEYYNRLVATVAGEEVEQKRDLSAAELVESLPMPVGYKAILISTTEQEISALFDTETYHLRRLYEDHGVHLFRDRSEPDLILVGQKNSVQAAADELRLAIEDLRGKEEIDAWSEGPLRAFTADEAAVLQAIRKEMLGLPTMTNRPHTLARLIKHIRPRLGGDNDPLKGIRVRGQSALKQLKKSFDIKVNSLHAPGKVIQKDKQDTTKGSEHASWSTKVKAATRGPSSKDEKFVVGSLAPRRIELIRAVKTNQGAVDPLINPSNSELAGDFASILHQQEKDQTALADSHVNTHGNADQVTAGISTPLDESLKTGAFDEETNPSESLISVKARREPNKVVQFVLALGEFLEDLKIKNTRFHAPVEFIKTILGTPAACINTGRVQMDLIVSVVGEKVLGAGVAMKRVFSKDKSKNGPVLSEEGTLTGAGQSLRLELLTGNGDNEAVVLPDAQESVVAESGTGKLTSDTQVDTSNATLDNIDASINVKLHDDKTVKGWGRGGWGKKSRSVDRSPKEVMQGHANMGSIKKPQELKDISSLSEKDWFKFFGHVQEGMFTPRISWIVDDIAKIKGPVISSSLQQSKDQFLEQMIQIASSPLVWYIATDITNRLDKGFDEHNHRMQILSTASVKLNKKIEDTLVDLPHLMDLPKMNSKSINDDVPSPVADIENNEQVLVPATVPVDFEPKFFTVAHPVQPLDGRNADTRHGITHTGAENTRIEVEPLVSEDAQCSEEVSGIDKDTFSSSNNGKIDGNLHERTNSYDKAHVRAETINKKDAQFAMLPISLALQGKLTEIIDSHSALYFIARENMHKHIEAGLAVIPGKWNSLPNMAYKKINNDVLLPSATVKDNEQAETAAEVPVESIQSTVTDAYMPKIDSVTDALKLTPVEEIIRADETRVPEQQAQATEDVMEGLRHQYALSNNDVCTENSHANKDIDNKWRVRDNMGKKGEIKLDTSKRDNTVCPRKPLSWREELFGASAVGLLEEAATAEHTSFEGPLNYDDSIVYEGLDSKFDYIDTSHRYVVRTSFEGNSTVVFAAHVASFTSSGICVGHTHVRATPFGGHTKLCILSSFAVGPAIASSIIVPQISKDGLDIILVDLLRRKGATVEVGRKEKIIHMPFPEEVSKRELSKETEIQLETSAKENTSHMPLVEEEVKIEEEIKP